MEGPFYGPSEHKVAGLSDVIVFDCCCVVVHVDLVAFKISYGDMHTHPQKSRGEAQICMYTHPLTHTLTHSRPNVHANHFAFQKSKIAQGGGRGSMASGFPKSACEVNES